VGVGTHQQATRPGELLRVNMVREILPAGEYRTP
jgi:hypothetical protein